MAVSVLPFVPEASTSEAHPQSGKAAIILDAARAVFVRHGYGAASMDAIARHAGVSKATLYAHFTGKDELFAEMVRTHCRAVAIESAAISLDTNDLRQGLIGFGRRFLALITSPDSIAIHRVVVAESQRFPELGRLFHDAGPSRVRASLTRYLEDANRAGLLRIANISLAAGQFVGMLKNDVYTHTLLGLASNPSDAGLEEVIAAAVDVLLRGYAPS